MTKVEGKPTTRNLHSEDGCVLRSSTGLSASKTGSNLPSEGKNHSTKQPRREDSRHQDEEKEDYDDRVTEHGVVESNWRKTGAIPAIALVDWRVGYPAV